MADDHDLTAARPPISPSPDAAPFWAAAARHELLLPYCAPCAGHFFYPRAFCPSCGSRTVEWRPVSGRGTLHTFCVQYRSNLPGFVDAGPFVTAIVELAEGPRLMSLLVGVPVDPTAIRCDMPVEVAFVDYDDGQSLPVFRPAG
jgi:uncharacterized OB-fold protein